MITYESFLKKYINNNKYNPLLELITKSDDYTITDISFNEEKKAIRFYTMINSRDKSESYNLLLDLLNQIPDQTKTVKTRSLTHNIIFHEKNNQPHFIRISHFSLEIRADYIVLKPYFTIDQNETISDDQMKFRCLKILFEPLKSKFMTKFLAGEVWRKFHIQFGYNILNNNITSQKLYCEIPGEKITGENLFKLNNEIKNLYLYSNYKEEAENFISRFNKIIPIVSESGFSSHLFSLETSIEENHFRHYFTPDKKDKDNLLLYQNLYENGFILRDQYENLYQDAKEKMDFGFNIYDVGLTFKNNKLRITNTYDI